MVHARTSRDRYLVALVSESCREGHIETRNYCPARNLFHRLLTPFSIPQTFIIIPVLAERSVESGKENKTVAVVDDALEEDFVIRLL